MYVHSIFTCILQEYIVSTALCRLCCHPQNLKKSIRLIFNFIYSFFVLTVLGDLSAFLLEDLQHEKGQIYALDLWTSQPRSLTLDGSKLSRPLLPNASWSGSWHISFVIMSVFLDIWNVIKWQFCHDYLSLPLCYQGFWLFWNQLYI